MDNYTPPIEDIFFVLKHIVGIESIMQLDSYSEIPMAEIEGILEEAGRFVVNEILPTDRIGDTEGARLNEDNTVTLPESFSKAYKEFVKAGWGSITFDTEWGGSGLPGSFGMAVSEMLTASNMAFSLCPLLTHGAINALSTHGTQEQKAFWLPKLITGEWSGTMNLTEPSAGSDVGALTTKAKHIKDDTYLISGQKIFITYGEHNLSENIVHLVLARIEGAPPGGKGISLFLVPKFLVKPDNSIGEKNNVTCLSIEKKMGIHASPTCVLEYADSEGYLIGDENQGLLCMFTMMNSARLGVGNSGLAIGERVLQKALAFSKERLQGRRPDTEKGHQSPIIAHPDVKRNLLYMKSLVEAMRCLVYYNSAFVDEAFSEDADKRVYADERASLLTPLSKAWCTDVANEIASIGIQIHGGAGFIEETGMAQHYRDVRITAIYEGTNGIQAADLVTRKLTLRNGEVLQDIFTEIECLEKELAADLADIFPPIADALAAAKETSQYLLKNLAEGNVDTVLAGATPYLELLSKLIAGWLLARSANIAKQQNYPEGFIKDKAIVARFFCHQILPTGTALKGSVTAGNEILSLGIPD